MMNLEVKKNRSLHHSKFPDRYSLFSLSFQKNGLHLFLFLGLLVASFLSGCQSRYENEATQNLSRTERVRYQQYMVQGQQLYRTHCSNCHQEEGTGLGQLIPPLAQSDYLLADVDRTLCLIKHGLRGEIIVNGQSYQQPMPANETLRDIEIAQIATYIYNHWGHAKGYIPTKRVSGTLRQCDDTTPNTRTTNK